jgi:hypothetical protein
VIPLRLVVYRNAHFLAPGKSVETVETPQQSSRVGFVYQYEGGSLEDVQLLLGQVRAGANRNRIACGLHAQAPRLWQSRAVERQLKSFSTITAPLSGLDGWKLLLSRNSTRLDLLGKFTDCPTFLSRIHSSR